jgi:HSP20 family protein
MSTIIRWNPFREMADMQVAMNRLFDDTWRVVWPAVEASSALPLDVYETSEGYTIFASLPGVEQDHINITLNQNVLTFSAEVPSFSPEQGQQALMVERPFGKVSRSITLPRPVHGDAVEAVYENGVLTLHLPVAPEAQPKRITVTSNGHMLQSKN